MAQVRFALVLCCILTFIACSSDGLYDVDSQVPILVPTPADSEVPSVDTDLPSPTPTPNPVPPTEGISFMLWVEQPTIEKREGYFEEFYEGLANFINGNPADIRISKVLIRFLDAGETSWEPAGNPWRPSLESPLFTHFIQRLTRDDLAIYAMPYLKVDQYPWTYIEGMPDIEQVVHVIWEWNTLLAEAGQSRFIEGVAYDPEGAGIGKEDIIRQTNHYKVLYELEDLKVGMALPGKGIAEAFNWGLEDGDLHLDEGYLQIYNLYTTESEGSILVDSFNFNHDGECQLSPGLVPDPYCDDSIYLMARGESDPAEAIFDGNGEYTLKNILTQPQMNWSDWSLPPNSIQHIYPMFSLEAIADADCIYPNTGTSICGQLNAFGSWEPEHFKRFVTIFQERMPELLDTNGQLLPNQNMGLFQYAFLPRSWVGNP